MKTLGSPGGLAIGALLLAAAVHPWLAVERFETNGMLVVALLALLFTLAAILRGLADRATAVLALGATLAVGALGYDALRGHTGRIELRPGEGRQAFEERGPGGIRLGLRPLRAVVSLESVSPAEAVLSVERGGTTTRERLTPSQAVALGPLRLGWGALDVRPRLTIALSRGDETGTVEVASGAPGTAADLTIELDRYFPDFALDARNLPFSRSDEPRNPAALLNVRKSGRQWRVFVLRAMPGVHKVEDLGWSLTLRDVTPDARLRIDVNAQPAAPLAAAGIAIVLAGLAFGWRH
jgi:hypothetical protein